MDWTETHSWRCSGNFHCPLWPKAGRIRILRIGNLALLLCGNENQQIRRFMNPLLAGVIGIVIGIGVYFVYDKYSKSAQTKAIALGSELLTRAKGDYEKAMAHVRKLI
jgi:hypothetical protein